MSSSVIIAHSAEAVNSLVALERDHIPWDIRIQPRGFGGTSRGWCKDCYPKNNPFRVDGLPYSREASDPPCPTLMKALGVASEETLVAVALILSGARL